MIRSARLSRTGAEHAFGERGDLLPEGCVRPLQVHGAEVASVGPSGAPPGAADALVTRQRGVAIAVVTADCVPVLLALERGGAVAAVHAGWRGTARGVIGAGVRALREGGGKGEGDGRIVAAVGPAIGPCCYEVGGEVIEALALLGPVPRDLVRPRGDRFLLDLPGFVALELERRGLERDSIDLLRACTSCGEGRFHSYRRDRARGGDGAAGRQGSWIRLPP